MVDIEATCDCILILMANTASKAATIYRSSFKGAVCAQMARGFGRQLLATAGMSLAASISS